MNRYSNADASWVVRYNDSQPSILSASLHVIWALFFIALVALWLDLRLAIAEAASLPYSRSDAMLQRCVVDEEGIVITPHDDTLYYNGVSICRVALTAFDDYERDGDARYLTRALKHADKFLDLCVRRGDKALVFLYPIDNLAWGAKANEWSSGMAQGLALSVMVRAHRHTGRGAYLEKAHAIFESLRMGIDEGGTIGYWADGSPAIEEVAQPGEPGAKILNGFITALTGVLEFAEYTDSDEALGLFHACMESIRHHLPEYDFGWWSTYDQFGTHASNYNETHCRQLIWCYEYTGIPVFLQYALKFASYDYEPPLAVSLVEGDPKAIIMGFGLESLTLPPPPDRKYFSYSGALPATLEIDLGYEHYFSGMRLAARAARANLTDYSILVSTDRAEWIEVARRSEDDSTMKEHFFEQAFLCRYVRVRVAGASNGNANTGWFTINKIVPTLRLPMVARGEGSSPYAHILLPGIDGRVADPEWRQVTGHARLYYDLSAARAFLGVRAVPGQGTKEEVAVTAAVSMTGHVWRPVALSQADKRSERWLAKTSPIARYVRLDIRNDSAEPLFLREVEMFADGDWPAQHPDRLRPHFASEIASVIGVRAGRLQLLGASQVLPSALRPGSSFRMDLFFECMEQLAGSEQYGCTLVLSQGDTTRPVDTQRIRTVHITRSWEGLRFREMLYATVPSDLSTGEYDIMLDIVQLQEGDQPGPSLLPEGPVWVGSLEVKSPPNQ